MLTRSEANAELQKAVQENPDRWEQHSIAVAENTALIAKAAKLDPEKSYILGLMHDIGRRLMPQNTL